MTAQRLNATQSQEWLLYLHSMHRLHLSRNVLREICSYFGPSDFAFVQLDLLKIYDLDSQQLTAHHLSRDFSGASFVSVDRNCILCFGNYPATKEVLALDLTSLQLMSLPSLCVQRFVPGVIKGQVKGVFFVFGGMGRANTVFESCERFELTSKSRVVGNMRHPRCSFSPCYFRALIYLACTRISYVWATESFNPDTETFARLPVSLPRTLMLDCGSVAFVSSGVLVILTGNNQMAYWRVETEDEFHVTPTDRPCISTQLPLLLNSTVLIANAFNRLRPEKFSLHSFTFLNI